MKRNRIIFKGIAVLLGYVSYAQQQPQYTQYMYNTMSINSAYAGTNGMFEGILLHRSQWVGFDGAPTTQSVNAHGAVGERTGAGINFVNDQLGPQSQKFITGNYAYRLTIGENTTLSLGLNAGVSLLSLDWSKGKTQDQNDTAFGNNINNDAKMMLGAGAFLYGEKWFLGLSAPNFLAGETYNEVKQSVGVARPHFYLQGGYVFDLIEETLKFKPAFLTKAVAGAPLTVDVSANFLIKERITLGAAYRFTDAFSGLIGVQISQNFFVGYAYDRTVTGLQKYNDGSHEVILKVNLFGNNQNNKLVRSPRFF